MAKEWYVSRERQRYGPYTWDELVAYTLSRNVVSADLVWSTSTDGWIPADQVPGLPRPAPSPQPAPPSGRSTPAAPEGTTRNRTLLFVAAGGVAILLLAVCGGLWVLLGDGAPELVQGNVPPAEVPDETPVGLVGEAVPFWEEDALGVAGTPDDADWQNYPDRREEEAAIAHLLQGFGEAMKQGDVDAAVAFMLNERQEAYRELFSANPEAMPTFADLLSSGEISFLSEQPGPTTFNRTAEYAIELDGFTFYVVLLKIDDTWVLYDF